MRRVAFILCLLSLVASTARGVGLTVDAAVQPVGVDVPTSAEVLVFSTWVRLPRVGSSFESPTIALDNGGELFVRFDGTRVQLLDNFDGTIDGGAGWPHVATGADGALRQWDAGLMTWTISGVSGVQDAPAGIAGTDDLLGWLSVIAGELAMCIGLGFLALLVASWWRRPLEF